MSRSNPILLPDEIDFSKISIKAPEPPRGGAATASRSTVGKGAKFFNILYDNKPLIMQLPHLCCSFGISKPENRPGGAPADAEGSASYSVNMFMGFDAMYTPDDIKEALREEYDDNGVDLTEVIETTKNVLEKFDDYMLTYAAQNFNTLFGANPAATTLDVKRAIASSAYSSSVKYGKNPDGSFNYDRLPFTRVKLPYYNGAFNMKYAHYKGEPLNILEDNLNNSAMKFIVDCRIWVINGKFGITWKAKNIEIVPTVGRTSTKDLSFRKMFKSKGAASKAADVLDEEEEEPQTSSPIAPFKPAVRKAAPVAAVENSADEAEEEETPTPAPRTLKPAEPTPTPTSRRVAPVKAPTPAPAPANEDDEEADDADEEVAPPPARKPIVQMTKRVTAKK